MPKEAQSLHRKIQEVVAAWVVARLKGEPDTPTKVGKSGGTLSTGQLTWIVYPKFGDDIQTGAANFEF